MKHVPVFFKHNLRLVFSDPGPIIQYLFVPILMMAILRPAQKTILVQEGFQGANGAEQVLPGITVMFAFFWTRTIGANFFQEYSWGTWERLRATQATSAELMVGKLLPGAVLILLQNCVLFGVGALIFGLDSKGPVLALVPVVVALNLVVLSLTLVFVAVSSSVAQIDAFGTLSTMLFAAIGGSLVPASQLPALAEDIAPALPSYWALQPARDVLLKGDGLEATIGPTFALLGFAAAFTLIAALRFRVTETKTVAA